MEERKIIVPGETIVKGEEYLPGDGTMRDNEEIVAVKFGLADISDKLVRVIPLSGVYFPRRGNTIIGEVIDINDNGWVIDFGGSRTAFLSISEYPSYVNRDELQDIFDFGDMVLAKVVNIKSRGIDLTVKMRGLGKLKEGMIIKINPYKVPRVIGKEGSMISIIKTQTNCDIIVGQNGYVWIKGQTIEDELDAKKSIKFICDNSYKDGLTDKIQEFIKKLK